MVDWTWISKDTEISDVVSDDMKETIEWKHDVGQDFLELSKQYFLSGYDVCNEIVSTKFHDNIKYDMWFLPGVYLFRQSVELILKAAIASNIKSNPKLQSVLVECKHNCKKLLNYYFSEFGHSNIDTDELIWLVAYIDSIEQVDSGSDLFRYPFKDEFMASYGNESLDIANMCNRLMFCYTLIHKLGFGSYYNDIQPQIEVDPNFMCMAVSGIGNCYLWDSHWSDGFHKQIVGYGEVSKFLFGRYEESKEQRYVFPLFFMLRNAIEIALKRLLHVQTEVSVDEKKVRAKQYSHLLYKDLWKNVKPIITHYATESGNDLEDIEVAELYILQIKGMDKNGDMFRYPCGYNLEYRFDNKVIDVKHMYTFMLAIFNFLDSVDTMLDNIREFESEMRSYYHDYY